MATPSEKLAASLAGLERLQRDGRRVFRSNELSRVHRERLVKHGFLRDVMKGWLISTKPDTSPGDSTPWFASFWEFLSSYCKERFGDGWHLSPEQSLMLHAESGAVPRQVIVCSPKGGNNTVELPFNTSIYDLRQRDMPSERDLVVRDGLQFFVPEAALIKVPEVFFKGNPVEAEVVLSAVRDASGLLARLLDGGHSAVAGRLAAAFRRVGRAELADEILSAMKAADYDVRENDPFAAAHTFAAVPHGASPIVGRLQALWQRRRGPVMASFGSAPGLPRDKQDYLKFVQEIYQSDAYHSLSIEGYQVSPELIERVGAGDWNPEKHAGDRDSRDALAARGYWQAFQLVRDAVARIIEGEQPGALVSSVHQEWYRELFQPCVAAGLAPASALAGYRRDAVYLRGSRHVPPRAHVVRDAMSALFELLREEPEASVRAVLGHWLFGYVHPYSDGNGRMARFLMNAMLASGGYPWTVIRVEDRSAYLLALESASVESDIAPITEFIAERVKWSAEKMTGVRSGTRVRLPK